MDTITLAPHPVTHSWHVRHLDDAEARAQFTARLKELQGVQEVVLDAGHGKITVTYDLLRVTADEIEAALAVCHISPSQGLLPTLEREWIHFADQNERDSLTFTPRSFNSPPHV